MFFATVSASVLLLKFWMDFKLGIWDRENSLKYLENMLEKEISKNIISRKNLYNKKKSKDIIIDCDAEIINSTNLNYNTAQKKRLLK